MSVARWLPKMRDELERLCAVWSVPLGVVVGWIEEESGGRPGESTTLREYGVFQIHPEESKDAGFDHERIRTDPAYGLECGYRLVDHYRRLASKLTAAAGVDPDDTSELNWRYAKFAHSIGAGAARRCMLAAGSSCASWGTFTAYCRDNEAALLQRTRHSPTKWAGMVDRVFETGAPYGLARLVCQQAPPF